ncbi:C-GCAxxG-C-C family (seleno)protein [Anaerovibrio slackiae]|uniref:C-GCAxxG-C-C family (seleno)protein n=1 Tax=Anaerovibrio slackiae TaxID=2652309 RepID=UPI00386AD2C1
MLENFGQLALACVLGGMIGYERQSRRKSAGLRTNILVCLGSCLIMMMSYDIYKQVEGMTNADPARLGAQVVSGIGFLGAGAISGAIALIGLLNSCGDLKHPSTKTQTYALGREILERFKAQNGSVLCHELKGAGTGKVLRSCPDCIMDACQLFEELYEAKLRQ